jgi:hypothetical protein
MGSLRVKDYRCIWLLCTTASCIISVAAASNSDTKYAEIFRKASGNVLFSGKFPTPAWRHIMTTVCLYIYPKSVICFYDKILTRRPIFKIGASRCIPEHDHFPNPKVSIDKRRFWETQKGPVSAIAFLLMTQILS